MSNWDSRTTIRVLSFAIALVPGSTTVQGATVYYEIVHPDGRASQFSRPLDLRQIQTTVDAASASITAQLLLAEGVQNTWNSTSPVYPSVSEQVTLGDQGAKS